jgi:anti-anti-sigma factor
MEGDVEGVNAAELTEEMLVELVAAIRALTTALPTASFEEVVAGIIVDAVQTVGADRAAVWLQRADAIEVVATTGMRATTVDRFQHVDVAPDTPGEKLLMRRTPVTWSTHEQAQRFFPVGGVANLGSGYVSPLHAEDRFSGVLFVGWTQQHRAIGAAERAFLEGIANCCALAVERWRGGPERGATDDDDRDEIVAAGETFSVRLTTSGGEPTAWVAGEIDCSNEEELERAVAEVLRAHPHGRLGFDLADVAFLSVAGARIVLGACQESSDQSQRYVLNSSAPARRVINLLAGDFDL